MNQRVFDSLATLKRRDIEVRSRLLKQGKLYGDYAPEMQQVHCENAFELEKIIAEHGWPGIALVGLQGCQTAWFVAQHSICTPELQRKFLTLLTDAAGRGDAPKKQLAYLEDRIRANENRPQLYGTVLDWNERGELGCDVEDPDNLDARRAQVGLPPYLEELQKHKSEVASEGGKPPKDFAAYKRKARAWAKSVGW